LYLIRHCHVMPSHIAIITPYNAQVSDICLSLIYFFIFCGI
jgi:hypothetical protein